MAELLESIDRQQHRLFGLLEKLGAVIHNEGVPPIPGQSRCYSPVPLKGDSATQEEVVGKEALALALLIEHPEWTDKHIAKVIHVARTTLYAWPRFRSAKAWLKSQRQLLPRGFKTKDRHLEAYSHEDEDD